MIIKLSPIADFPSALSVSKSGEKLTINGDTIDFAVLPDGAEISDENARALHPMIAGPIVREGGEISLTLILPVPADCNDPWMCFPEPIAVTSNGPVDLPFATWSETSEVKVAGGTNIVTTTHRWHQADTVETVFVPEPEEEEA